MESEAMATWQVQQAKNRFSEMLERARNEGPQTITRHGKPSAVVLSAAEYEELRKEGKAKKPNLIEFLRSGPYLDDVDLERSKDSGRDIDLE
jgi:prevent-host-death family protein